MYALDHAAIQAAADFLELRHPVHVQIDGSFGLKLGQYVGLRKRGHRARWSTPDWPERRPPSSRPYQGGGEQWGVTGTR